MLSSETEGILMKHDRLTIFLLTFSTLILLALPLAGVLPSGEELEIYDSVIRLHILADSDEPEAQALKLRVRDGILESVSGIVEGSSDVTEARVRLESALPELEDGANRLLALENSPLTARVTLTRESYPTRDYRGVSLPAGEYTSLRILLGSGEGANWWCVLFPRLCVAPASGYEVAVVDESEFIEAGLTPRQIELITGKSPRTVVKLRFLEWLASLSA